MSAARVRPRRLEYMGAMAAGLAHEVKNPLSTMTVTLQLMAEDFAEPHDPREERTLKRAKLLLGEARRLDRIVQDFLELARGYEVSLQSVDLSLLIPEIVRLHEAENDKLGIALRVALDPAARHVVVDPKFLRLALTNLLVNAQQAMHEQGGEIFIETELRERDVDIRVTDTGPGIPADKLEKIFMPFWSSKQAGTGLGLAVTRRIVEELGGEVKVHSEVGRGTRFTIRVPRTPAALPDGTRDAGAGPQGGGA